MGFLDILLIIICGAGLVHGVIISIFLYFLKSKRTTASNLLAIIILVMALRVGKSVLFIYASHLEFTIILIGLSMLLLLGPLLFFYTRSMTVQGFQNKSQQLLHLVPFFLMLGLSFFLTEQWFINHGVAWSFFLLAFIYGHFAFYIFKSWRITPRLNDSRTKNQKLVIKWLNYFIIGIVIIWCSYVLNIFEDQIPYILGPILYSICIYILTYKAYRLNIINHDGSVFKIEEGRILSFNKINDLITSNKLYLDSNLNLDKVSELTSVTSHQISSIINEQTGHNFNNYINQFRIEEATKRFKSDPDQKLTIAHIAYDVGFNSLSSFNAAFKKFEKITPSKYRNSI